MNKKIHFMGAGGIGVSALIRHYLRNGFDITACDIKKTGIVEELEKLGVKFYLGHDSTHIGQGLDELVYTSAVVKDHPELARAKELNIKCLSYPEALGEVCSSYRTIAVAGTNGKSTTTAIIGLVFESALLDPTVIVGSKVGKWQSNYRHGTSDLMIVEACEYRKHFLNIRAESVAITNIEAEHLDAYKNLDEIKGAFLEFINNSAGDGFVVLNMDDESSMDMRPSISGNKKIILYGKSDNAHVILRDRTYAAGHQECFISYGMYGKTGETNFKLSVPGIYNAYNALAAFTVCLAYGISPGTISKALSEFQGIWRRFEKVGDWRGAQIYSDYAHHPTSIKGVIDATREFFPEKNIIFVFQPHQRERTCNLREDFMEALSLADNLVLMEIYDVAGREQGIEISSKDLMDGIVGPKIKKYAKDFDETKEILGNIIKGDEIVVMMGAGDIDDLARRLCI